MTIVPMGDRVLLKKEEAEEKTAGGLILAASAKEESPLANILALGADAPKELKVGDRVMYAKFAGEGIDVDGQACILVKAEDILAIVK